VTYGKGAKADPFVQDDGVLGHWQREQEWRVLGDVDLGALDSSEVVVVTATDEEARELRTWSPYEVRSFGCAEPLGTT